MQRCQHQCHAPVEEQPDPAEESGKEGEVVQELVDRMPVRLLVADQVVPDAAVDGREGGVVDRRQPLLKRPQDDPCGLVFMFLLEHLQNLRVGFGFCQISDLRGHFGLGAEQQLD